jgi:hypothetical protein
MVHVWQVLENLVCQRAGPRENDFASRIKTDADPGNDDEVRVPQSLDQPAPPPRSSSDDHQIALLEGGCCHADGQYVVLWHMGLNAV